MPVSNLDNENTTHLTAERSATADSLYGFVWFMEKNINDMLKGYWMGVLIPINVVNNSLVIWICSCSSLMRRDTAASVRVYYVAMAIADLASSLSNHTMYFLSMPTEKFSQSGQNCPSRQGNSINCTRAKKKVSSLKTIPLQGVTSPTNLKFNMKHTHWRQYCLQLISLYSSKSIRILDSGTDRFLIKNMNSRKENN